MEESNKLSNTFLFTKASRAIIKVYAKHLEPLRITPIQSGILVFLNGKTMCLNDLSKELLIDRMSITTMLNKLTKKELVQRKQCCEDLRKCSVSLTPKGEQLMKQIEQVDQKINTLFEKEGVKLDRSTLLKIYKMGMEDII